MTERAGSLSRRGGIPRATYRVQFNAGFTFQQAREIVQYLETLGVSHLYASPVFGAAPDSTHGYDVCDFGHCHSRLGEEADFAALSTDLRRRAMGILLDMVPNHMGIHPSNLWWADVLEFGPSSAFASWFDIDWHSACCDAPKVIVPTLGERYGTALESGKLRLTYESGGFFVSYYERRFPLSPRSYTLVLDRDDPTTPASPAESDLIRSFWTVGQAAHHESQRYEPAQLASFRELKSSLAAWYLKSGRFRSWLDQRLTLLNGEPDRPRSFDRLHEILERQHYRLAYWRVGPEEINYRRFFDVTQLVSLRMERGDVFEAAHELVFKWLKRGIIDGLRIDHPDGLRDPKQYLVRLQETYRRISAESADAPLYVVVEKILTHDEPLRADWPVAGTTGYDYLARLNGLFVDTRNLPALGRRYSDFTGVRTHFDDLVYETKLQILSTILVSEWNRLSRYLFLLAKSTRKGADFAFSEIKAGLGLVIAAFPTYRSYIGARDLQVASLDEQFVHSALNRAAAHAGRLEPDVLAFVRSVVMLRADEVDLALEDCREVVLRLQQLTGPVMAKGLEDTAFYRFHRLVSLNEVGGDADVSGKSRCDFHDYNKERSRKWPHALSATSTHDTKRGEDVRARINVLSEIPEEWEANLRIWGQLNASLKQSLNGKLAPDCNDEYLLYQTFLGAWPVDLRTDAELDAFRTRVNEYMLKAVKEAKENTSWTDPDTSYESALKQFIDGCLKPGQNSFLESFLPLQRRVAFFGLFNSLSQTVLKLTAPGVPDLYQGTEFLELSLVDPDNRRPVDYASRTNCLRGLIEASQKGGQRWCIRDTSIRGAGGGGEWKLFVTWSLLQLRKKAPHCFDEGEYHDLEVIGTHSEHAVAFARMGGDDVVVVIVPRFCVSLDRGRERPPMGEVWEDTSLVVPSQLVGRRIRNVFTCEEVEVMGAAISVARLLATFPVGVFRSAPRS